jgi:pimeloyl-[acyl-carrier protein] methyl ester esterase
MPSVEVLNGGLEILKTADLREALSQITVPFLRLYGYLDGLVPRKISGLLNERWPQSEAIIFPKAAHAPFISHPQDVCRVLEEFHQQI